MATIDVERVVELVVRGFSVFPCRPRGKSPLTTHGYKDATRDIDQIKSWWKGSPEANVGIACGASELLVIDIDGIAGESSLDGYEIPDTTIVQTGHGRHLYFKKNSKQYKNAVKILPGVDIRTEGSSVIAPPSVHESGNEYRFTTDAAVCDIPEWLEELLKPFERDTRNVVSPNTERKSWQEQADALDEPESDIPDGIRSAQLTSIAGTMRRRGMTHASIEAALLLENEKRCKPPMSREEVIAIAASVSQYAVGDTLFNLTDTGNAERLVYKFADEIRYRYDTNQWLVWNGYFWHPDREGSIVLRARDVARDMYEQGWWIDDKDEAKKLASYALKSESKQRLAAMVDIARSLVPIAVADLDADPMLLNVENGIVDLRNGELRPPDKLAYITKAGGVRYDTSVGAPRWERFLGEIFDSNIELISFVQRAVGYSLTGDVREQCLFILHGTGSNGKSTFVEALLALLGDYGSQTQPETILATKRQSGRASPELAMMPGIRFLATVETGEDRKLDESLIKQLTGGDTILTRKLFSDYFDFRPEFKLWFATNHLPNITGVDHAIWRRIRRIPFMVTIPDAEQDKTLAAQLRAELPGILNWCILGALEWQRRGLEPPAEVSEATRAYRQSMDIIGDFLADCVTDAEGIPTPKAEFYLAYKNWCSDNGETALTQQALSRKLRERGYVEKRLTAGVRAWKNVAVRSS